MGTYSDPALILPGAVTATEILDGAITNAKVNAAAAIDGSKLADGAVTNVKVNAAAAIDGSKLVDGAITNAKIAAATIEGSKLVDDAITNAKIAAGAVGQTEVDSTLKRDTANGVAGLDGNNRIPPQYGGIPAGVILPFGGSSAPSGWLLCNGSAISRTSYAILFAVVGTSYGVGNGSTTFNLPNSAGRVPVGIGGSGVTNRGDTGGEQTHTLTETEMPSHSHVDGFSQALTASGTARTQGISGGTDYGAHSTSSTGGGSSHNNMQPYFGTNYIIKT